MKLESLKTYRDEIIAISQSCHAPNIRVFGSVARGEATDSSDVDFLVDVAPEQSVLDLIRLIQDLSDLLGCNCLLYTSPSPRDRTRSRMPSSA